MRKLFLIILLLKLINFNFAANAQIKEVYAWKQMDFVFPNNEVRQFAINSGMFVQRNSINPIGVGAHGSRVFIAMPRWKNGVPATLATIPFPSNTKSPLLTPYPDWSWSRQGNCDGLTSVYRFKIDECNRLWALDTGVVNSFVQRQKLCPSQVVVFDLNTDRMLLRYILPDNVLKEDTQPVTIEVEYPNGNCGPSANNAFLYIADVNAFGLIVVDLEKQKSWRVQHRSMYPTPDAGVININQEKLNLMDGIIALALRQPGTTTGTRPAAARPPVSSTSGTPYAASNSQTTKRKLYYYALSSMRMNSINTEILRNEELSQTSEEFKISEGKRSTQAADCSIDRNGVIFMGHMGTNSIACWNTNKPYLPANIATLDQNNTTMQFIATTDVDSQGRLWAISTRVHKFFLNTQDINDVNFRVFMADSTTNLVKGTPCEWGQTDSLVFSPV